ncbi:MAG TPA: hypothetical protein VGL42_11260 [Opitutaceae bacterium]|jgi:hypothetical protein
MKRLRISVLALGALAFAWAGPDCARADSKKPLPAPNADLVALKASINALAVGPLHDLAANQTVANARIDTLQATLDRALKQLNTADLGQIGRDAAATRGAVAGILADDDGIARQVTGVDARVAAAAEVDAANRRDWSHQLTAEDDRLARWEHEQREWEEKFQAETQEGADAAVTAGQISSHLAQRQTRFAAAALAVLLGLGWLIQSRLRHRANREVLLTLSRLGADLRQNAPRQPPAAPSLPEWEGLEHRLRALTDRWENLAGQLPAPHGAGTSGSITDGVPTVKMSPAAGRIVGGVSVRNGHDSRAFVAEPHSAVRIDPDVRKVNGNTLTSGDKPTVSVSGAAEPSVASRHLWPAEFLDPESPLSRWRFLLESHLDSPYPALPVLGSLLGLRAILARPSASPAEVAAAAFRLSEALHAYWQSLSDLSADDCQQASAAWLQLVRSLIGAVAPRLELREVLPSARIDLDLMHPVREGPGNHLNVADVFSWAVLDRSAGDRPKVLHRALVASS